MTSRPRSISRGALAAVLAALAYGAVPVAGASAQVMTITSGPAGPTNDNTPEFSFLPPAGQCRLLPVMQDFTSCTSPFPQPGAEYAIPLGDGDYAFEVRAGEADAPARREFTIDTLAPETQITGGPGDTTDTTAVFLFSAPGATGFSCRLDGGAWGPCGSPQTYSGLSLGRHRFEVTAIDAAGNQDAAPAEHVWQVLRPGLVIPGTVKLATALAKELVQLRRALARMGLRALARRRTLVFRTFDALTAGTVEVRARARIRQRPGRRRWIRVLEGEREVAGAGRHRVRATVTRKGRRLARRRLAGRRKRLPLELRLNFTDLAKRSLWATSKLTLKP
jgi:hypothetical protein